MKGHSIEVAVTTTTIAEAIAEAFNTEARAVQAAIDALSADPFAGLDVPCDDHGSEG